MLLAATTVAALLIASPSASDADRIAADSGFLLGSAHRCGIATERLVRAGRLVHGLIAAASTDGKEEETARDRFAAFFLVSAVADTDKNAPAASCETVTKEFTRFEHHPVKLAGAGE
jgi:hypothetical protein